MISTEAYAWVLPAAALLTIAATMAVGIWIGIHLRARESNRRDRGESTFFDQIRDAALVTERGRIIAANAAALEQFGYSSREIVGRPVASLLCDPADEARFLHAIRSGAVTDFPVRLKTSGGGTCDCLVTATADLDDQGRITGCRGIARDVTERNRIVAELRRTEQDYRGLFENAYDAILILDPLYETVLDANYRACVMYGFSREEFIGRSMVTLSVDPRRGKAFLRATREESGRYATFESEHLCSDGSVMHVEINAAEVRYKGRLVILSINRDVSSRRRAEKTIRESEERFRLLLESVSDYAIVMLDPIGRIVSWNEGAERITGYTAAETLERSAATVAAVDAETLRTRLVVAAENGRVEYESRATRKDGSSFAAAVTITRIVDDGGVLRGYACVTRDITARVQLEKAREEILTILRDVATEWTATFDAVQVPIVMLDEECTIRRLNRAAQTLAGRPFAELVDLPARDLPGEPWHTIARLAGDAFAGDAQSVRATGDGSVWQVSTALASHGENARAIVVAYDLTLVTQLEASLRQNEVAAALGSLVAGVAHEVRNPLFTISATLDAWEARYGRTEGIERYAVSLRDQVNRLNRLMRDLLEYGRPNPLVFAHGSVCDVIRRAASDCATLAAQERIELVLDLVDLHPVAIDSARLEQVFLNVIDNAIRHSSAGGSVRVVAAIEGGQFVCRVLDDGPGLGGEEPESLFAPMYTRRRGGTGLGLPIARKIVTAHGGTITIASRDDARGAVVTIALPLDATLAQERRTA